MLTEEQRHNAARDLVRSERERKPIPQLSKTYPNIEIEDAYRIQDLWAESRVAAGARVVGHKIGLTSRAMQQASKMTEPDYGRILDDAMFGDGARISADLFIRPRLEVELAFIMAEDLSGPACGYTTFSVRPSSSCRLWRLSTIAPRSPERSQIR